MSTQEPINSVAEPAWEVAYLFPPQGHWSEGDYLALTTNRLVELSEGRVEVLPMPTELHQLIVLCLYQKLSEFIQAKRLGLLLVAPLRIRLWEGKFREPDLLFMLAENSHRRSNRYWNGADLVIEVISEDDPDRDLVEKRAEYAHAGIPEYWIVDPRSQTVSVLTLDAEGTSYRDQGPVTKGNIAVSKLLSGFSVAVADIFAQ